MIRTDDLQFQGLTILQDTDEACFSADAVLLVDFLRLHAHDTVVDLGAGNGVLSILGQAKTGASFVGVEKRAAQCALARRSALLNRQDIPFHCMDVQSAPKALGCGRFSAAVMNPPYFTAGEPSQNAARADARHAQNGLLDAFAEAAFLLLDNGGKLFCCYPAQKLTDLLYTLRAHRLEPKRLQPALSDGNGVPKRVLVEARKLAGPGLVWEPEAHPPVPATVTGP